MSAQFDGATFSAQLDGPRLNRQLDRVLMLMLDGRWRTLAAIQRIVGGSEAGVSARLRDLRKDQHGGYRVERERSDRRGLWRYRINNRPQLEFRLK